MSIDTTRSTALAEPGNAWLRDQTARLHQRHLQFRRHFRLDVDALLARAAKPAQALGCAAAAAGHTRVLIDPIRRTTIEAVDHSARLRQLPTKRRLQAASAATRRRVRGPATLGEFASIHRLGVAARREWMAVLADGAEVVVPDVHGDPSPLAVEKAVSIVQSRAYLEQRARQLLAPLAWVHGGWSLVTLDLGFEAQHRACEFLMCFAFQPVSGALSVGNPYVEIGFSLPAQTGGDRVFVLTVKTAVGLPIPCKDRHSFDHLRVARHAQARDGPS